MPVPFRHWNRTGVLPYSYCYLVTVSLKYFWKETTLLHQAMEREKFAFSSGTIGMNYL